MKKLGKENQMIVFSPRQLIERHFHQRYQSSLVLRRSLNIAIKSLRIISAAKVILFNLILFSRTSSRNH